MDLFDEQAIVLVALVLVLPQPPIPSLVQARLPSGVASESYESEAIELQKIVSYRSNGVLVLEAPEAVLQVRARPQLLPL